MAITKILRGDWMDNGYIRDTAPRKLRITIIDGKAYDADMIDAPCGTPREFARVEIDDYGYLTARGTAYDFLPDNGEIDRIGRTAFER